MHGAPDIFVGPLQEDKQCQYMTHIDFASVDSMEKLCMAACLSKVLKNQWRSPEGWIQRLQQSHSRHCLSSTNGKQKTLITKGDENAVHAKSEIKEKSQHKDKKCKIMKTIVQLCGSLSDEAPKVDYF